MAITIKTKLDPAICSDEGGGRTLTYYEYNTGPRNLIKAIEQYYEHLDDVKRRYGGIGCGWSWIEIDGVRICDSDLYDLLYGEDYYQNYQFGPLKVKSRTTKCREFIEYVRSGNYGIKVEIRLFQKHGFDVNVSEARFEYGYGPDDPEKDLRVLGTVVVSKSSETTGNIDIEKCLHWKADIETFVRLNSDDEAFEFEIRKLRDDICNTALNELYDLGLSAEHEEYLINNAMRNEENDE